MKYLSIDYREGTNCATLLYTYMQGFPLLDVIVSLKSLSKLSQEMSYKAGFT